MDVIEIKHLAWEQNSHAVSLRKNMEQLLSIENLSVSFDTKDGIIHAVRDISLHINKGETLAIVGESGSGKSVFCRSVLKILPENAKIGGKILTDKGEDIVKLSERQMRKVRGTTFGMVFQDPMATLNPVIPIGKQIIEAIRLHQKISQKDAEQKAIELLELVGIDNAKNRISQQPHFFSGGMRQRCALAIALAPSPKILFADEPTTALDVTVQARLFDLLKEIQKKTGIAIVIVTHDLGVVARIADRVAIMYAGKIVETGTAEEIFYHSKHPYTWGLLGALPSLALKNGELTPIQGMPPSLITPPQGDAFASRNEYALAIDYKMPPPLFSLSDTHKAATWLLDKRAPHIEAPLYTQKNSL